MNFLTVLLRFGRERFFLVAKVIHMAPDYLYRLQEGDLERRDKAGPPSATLWGIAASHAWIFEFLDTLVHQFIYATLLERTLCASRANHTSYLYTGCTNRARTRSEIIIVFYTVIKTAEIYLHNYWHYA